MRLVIIESPFRGETEKNIQYLRLCIRDSILRNESPYASHIIIPGSLDDEIAAERDLGIRCGYAWWQHAHLVAFYTDRGWSEGMKRALHRAKTMQMTWEERSIDNEKS